MGNPASSADPAEVLPGGLTLAEPGEVSGTWRLDVQTGHIWWSAEMYQIFGVGPDDFEPTVTRMFTAFDEESGDLLRRQLPAWRANPTPFAATYRLNRPDGSQRAVEVFGWPAPVRGGDPRRIVGTCRDVTRPEITRERIARLQATILRAAGDGIAGVDLDGRIVFSNPALQTLMRREGEELRHLRLHDLVHRDRDGRELHRLSECPFRDGSGRSVSATDTNFHRADGTRIEAAYVLVPIDDRAMRGVVVSLRDTTARRAAGRLLQTSLHQVQTLSAQRGALLRHLAEAEERERLRLAADIHDDTIQALGAVALRLSNAGGRADSESARTLLTDAEQEVRGVTERLRNLMFELMPPVANRDLRTAVQTYSTVLFDGSEITCELQGDAEGLSPDRYLVAYRLIQEALRNVLKHSLASRVEVRFEATASELLIRVADDGVGLRGGAVAPTHAGLRIVRQRVEAAGGSAGFGPGLDGRGSSIELRLPLEQGRA